MQRFEKKAREIYTLTMDYGGRLPLGATLESSTILIYTNDINETDVTDDILLGEILVSSSTNQVKFKVQGGIKSKEYLIKVSTDLSNGDLYGDNLLMTVVPG